jgi:hypothetical protein
LGVGDSGKHYNLNQVTGEVTYLKQSKTHPHKAGTKAGISSTNKSAQAILQQNYKSIDAPMCRLEQETNSESGLAGGEQENNVRIRRSFD